MSDTAVIHEQAAVPQPAQHGRPGGMLRHTSIITGTVAGLVLAVITYAIGSHYFVPWGEQNADFSQVGLDALVAATYVAWVIGFKPVGVTLTARLVWIPNLPLEVLPAPGAGDVLRRSVATGPPQALVAGA